MPACSSWSMLSRRAADFRLGCTASVLWRKQCSRVRFVLPSSNLEHVVVPEPSCVRVPFWYLACRITEFVGSCKMCNLVFFLKSFVMERILSSELSFFILLMSWLFMRFLSSFHKNRVFLFLVRKPFVASWLMSSFCSNMITLPWCWMDKSKICPLNFTLV